MVVEATTGRTNEWRKVQVSVGDHIIAEARSSDPAWCKRYAESMRSRLPFATVTNEPLSEAVA